MTMENGMKAKRTLIIPGGSSRAAAGHDADFTALEEEGAKRGHAVLTFPHPGQQKRGGEKWQDGEFSSETSLDYAKSVRYARNICRHYEPNRIIGRSYGCTVAVGLLGCGDDWVRHCEGAVLWGAWLPSMAERLLGTPEKMQKDFCERLKQAGTHATSDFFLRLPAIDNLVTQAQANLRLGRGTEDKYNYREELDFLGSTHRRTQPLYQSDVETCIEGLGHTVPPIPLGHPLYQKYLEYLDCLFCPFRQKDGITA